MFSIELKRCMHPILIFVSIIVTVYIVYSSIQPSGQYYYGQPLNKKEFIYFGLKDDYNAGDMHVYKGENLSQVTQQLTTKEKEAIKLILIEINPNFNINEKMSDVNIKISTKQCLKLMKEFENKTGYKTDYYFMLDFYSYELYRDGRFQANANNKNGHNSVAEEKKDFELILESGISNAYARYAVDSLGLIMGLLSIFFASFIFSRDRKNEVEDYLYTSNAKSYELICCRTFSAIMPLILLCYFVTVWFCIYFYRQGRFYGYDIHFTDFFKYTSFWVIPTILITVTSSIFLDLLIENSIVVFIVQFTIWYISISNVLGRYNLFGTVIRFSTFGYADLFNISKGGILVNRILMILFSILFLIGSIMLFEKKRGGNLRLLRFVCGRNHIQNKNRIKKHGNKGILYYNVKRVLSVNVLICVIYLMVLIPITYRIKMDASDIAVIGENIVIFSSAFLLIPISNIEFRNQVQEFVYVSNTPYFYVYFQRLILGGIALMFFVGTSLFVMSMISNVKMGLWCIGVFFSALYLGLIGLVVSEITTKNSIGYFVYIIYYLICVIMKEQMPYLSVCGYTYDIKNSKYGLVIGIFLCIVMLFFVLYDKVTGR